MVLQFNNIISFCLFFFPTKTRLLRNRGFSHRKMSAWEIFTRKELKTRFVDELQINSWPKNANIIVFFGCANLWFDWATDGCFLCQVNFSQIAKEIYVYWACAHAIRKNYKTMYPNAFQIRNCSWLNWIGIVCVGDMPDFFAAAVFERSCRPAYYFFRYGFSFGIYFL